MCVSKQVNEEVIRDTNVYICMYGPTIIINSSIKRLSLMFIADDKNVNDR